MKKEINIEGFNQAVITHYCQGGDCICTLQEVDEEGNVIRECENIVLSDGVHFVLTEEELNELNPQIIEQYESNQA